MAQSAPDHPFVATLRTRFGGVLYAGAHNPDSRACVIEVATVVRKQAWSDDPSAAKLPDLRPLNDALWSSDQARTEALIPIVLALWDWSTWMATQQQRWATKIAERTIREILPPMLRQIGLDTEADRCEKEGTEEAARAAGAVRTAAAVKAAGAAEGQTITPDSILQLACRIWTEEAHAITSEASA